MALNIQLNGLPAKNALRHAEFKASAAPGSHHVRHGFGPGPKGICPRGL